MVRVTFFMEQHIGHRSFYENLRRFIEPAPQVAAAWVEVTYQEADDGWRRWSLVPGVLRGTLVGRAQVRRGLREHPCDVAFFNTQVPAALAGRVMRSQPYVLCTDITPIQYDRLSEHYGHRPDGTGPLSIYKHRVNVALFRHAARILPWSTWTRDSLIADYGVAPERIEVVAPGVDTEVWHPAPRPGTGPMRILFVGGDFYRKGGELLLEAFRALPAGLAELVLVTRSDVPAGEGITVYRDMHPNSPALIALAQSCDVFVLPTQAEAFGIAAVEAGALGLPVIATEVGGLRDIVADGETGYLIRPGDGQRLLAHLDRLARRPALRQKMGRAARARVETHFDAHKQAVRIAAIIHTIAHRGKN